MRRRGREFIGVVEDAGQEVTTVLLDGTVEPGKVFDAVTDLKAVPAGYQDMADRTSLKVLIKP